MCIRDSSGTVSEITTITAPNGATQTAVVIVPDGEQKVDPAIAPPEVTDYKLSLIHLSSLWFACLCEHLGDLREPLGQVPTAIVGEEQGAPVLLGQNLPMDPVLRCV